ncbi:MAG: FAD-dependent oxidoreductase, partial [Candidatus Omnitrophica bacterium]|nr:FAD-dependent oxidoreductase [Candidatus Omnitrophota bacterium]
MDRDIYDVIIIGGGPAGLTSGIYTGRGQLKGLLIECFVPPPQAVMADLIENYPGFLEGINGFALIERFKNQAKNFGLKFQIGRVEAILPQEKEENIWQVKLEDKIYRSLTVILAVGASPRQLGIPGEEALRGKGVSYCAICDGAFFKDKDIVVVGGGDSAVVEALFLTRFARKVSLVHRRNRLRAAGLLAQRTEENKKIEFIWNSVVSEIEGSDRVEGIHLKNVVDEAESRIACDGVFIAVGYTPNTDFLRDLIELDKSGYIITDQAMKTSSPGIFACG